MVKTKCAFQLIRKELAAESEQVNRRQVNLIVCSCVWCIHKISQLVIKVLLVYFSVDLAA